MKRFCIILSVATAIFGLSLSSPVSAITNRDKAHVFNDTAFYDPTDELCVQNNGATSDDGSGDSTNVSVGKNQAAREATAFAYFAQQLVKEGIPLDKAKIMAAGIVGNLAGESGVNPKSDNPAATNGGGGIAQWEGGRWSGPNGLLAFAKARNKPWNDFGVQLDFLWWELHHTESQALTALKRVVNSTSNTASAIRNGAIIFMLEFERPSIPHTEVRVGHAERIYAANQGKVLESSPDTTPAPTDAASCLATDTAGDEAAANNSGPCPASGDGITVVDKGIGEGYKNGPKNPVKIHLCQVGGILVNSQIATGLKAMLAKSKKPKSQGGYGSQLTGGGYRSMDSQIDLRKQSCGTDYYSIWNKPSGQCKWPVARPGYSNHQMGNAIDFSGISISDRSNPKYRWIDAYMKGEGKHFLKNLPSEAWHWSIDGR